MSGAPDILLSFDIEEFDLPEEYAQAISDDDKISIPALGTTRILDVLKSRQAKATFFVTAYFAERQPELVRRMVADGHEVGSHGMNHTTFSPEHLRQSRDFLEKLTGKTIRGFRMARLGKVSTQEIRVAGYEYESSINPTWLLGRYNNLSKPIRPYQEACGLWQYPISVLPFVRFPLFWLSYKNLPLALYGALAKAAVRFTGYYNMYSHPWEYNERCKEPQWHIPGYITRHAGLPYAKRLSNLTAMLQSVGNLTTFSDTLP